MSTLAEYIEGRREQIVQRWVDDLVQRTASQALDRETLVDSMREFLDQLVEALKETNEGGVHLAHPPGGGDRPRAR
jgi:hypothetical protein